MPSLFTELRPPKSRTQPKIKTLVYISTTHASEITAAVRLSPIPAILILALTGCFR